MTAVVDAFKLARDTMGELYASSHQRHLLAHFFDLLDFGRREGAADDLSPRFVRHPGHHTIKPVDENEDEIGKAADVLRESRRQDSLTKRTRVLAVVDDMKADGDPITFLAVARKAGVSNWLVYAEGVREHIEAARKTKAGTAARDSKAGSRVSDASLAVDLELTRTALRRVRDERDRLKVKVQRGLGQQIDQAGNADLERRIRALGEKLQQREDALAEVRAERNGLQEKLSEAEDTVGALRRSLKQMMRDQCT